MFEKSKDIFCLFALVVFLICNQAASQGNDLSEKYHEETSKVAIPFDSKNQDLEAFLSIPFTKEHEETIRELCDFFLNKYIGEILADQEYLWTIKDRIETIHMLRFMGFLISDPDMYERTKRILNAEDRSNYLLIGLEIAFGNLLEEGLLDQHVSGFATFVKLDKNTIQSYLDQKNYRGLLRYLAQI